MSGYDASGRVDDLAAQLGKQCTPIAIGQSYRITLIAVIEISLSLSFSLSLSLTLSLSLPPFLSPSGSAEGFSLAEKAISSASKAGRWVLLKNVHLAPQWLVQLEKKFHSLTPHTNFRLFLTMEINPKVRWMNWY